ncbi:chaperone regulator [Perkinsela sp. CCAP 1560/4]|nr:chaperone regulator [Perkinsela sp. CCAP 1560/4]|eukprot:KNH05332.1 chaperone regulator [Perkinsela sp. CCAP 1560/4]
MSVDTQKILEHIVQATNHFDTLGLGAQRQTCTTTDVVKAYRRLAARIHPDKCADDRAKEAFDKVNQASKVLGNEALLKKLQSKFQKGPLGAEGSSNASEAQRSAIHAQHLRRQSEREERRARKEVERVNAKRQNEEILVNQKKWKAHQQSMMSRK